MIDKENIAANILRARHILKETQAEFAANCGISVETLSLIERKKYNPSLELLQSIAAYIGCTVIQLLTKE